MRRGPRHRVVTRGDFAGAFLIALEGTVRFCVIVLGIHRRRP
jgi:hypothetical protein